MGDAGDKRKRNANWNEIEKSLLKRLVSERIDVVECKDATTNTHKKKKQAWEEICKSFNHLNDRKRDQTQLIKQWRGMKMMLKQVVHNYRTEVRKTGGGPKPVAPADEDLNLIEKMQDEFSVDPNRFDSNNRNRGEIPEDSVVVIEADIHLPPPESDVTFCSFVDTPVTTRATANRFTYLDTDIEFIEQMSREHDVDFTEEAVIMVATQEQGDTRDLREEQGTGEFTQERQQGGQRHDQEEIRRREQGQGRRQEQGSMRNKKEKHEDILKSKLFLLQKKQLEEREKREIALHEQTMRHNEALFLKRMAILEQEFERNKK